jgi:large repetitive protein
MDPTGAVTYGWLGAKERALDSTGLTLMGARLYNPVSGLFTSVDPIEGGNTTAYAYPQDPISKNDVTGLRSGRQHSSPRAYSDAESAAAALKAAGKKYDPKAYSSYLQKKKYNDKIAKSANAQKRAGMGKSQSSGSSRGSKAPKSTQQFHGGFSFGGGRSGAGGFGGRSAGGGANRNFFR